MAVIHEKELSNCKSCRVQLVNLLKVYLNFQYFSLCCPFRLITGNDGQTVISKSNGIHKILCFICTVLGFIWMFRSLQIRHVISNTKDPSMYLFLAVHVTNLFIKIGTIKRYWFDQDKLLEMANFILDTRNDLPYPDTTGKFLFTSLSYIMSTLACLLFTGMGVTHYFVGNLYYVTSVESANISVVNWSASLWWDRMLIEGRATFMSDERYSNTSVELLFGGLAAVGYLWRLILGANEELFSMIIAFIIWITTGEFQARLRTSSNKKLTKFGKVRSWSEISREYEALKMLTEMTNNTIGWTLLCMVLQSALYTSVNTDLFLTDAGIGWSKIILFMISSLPISFVFLLTADSAKQVHREFWKIC